MKKSIFKLCALFLLAAIICTGYAPAAQAKVTVTVINNRSSTMWLAFCWNGFDMPDDRRVGWYSVKAGETRKLVFKNAISSLTMDGFGYYATSKNDAGKKVVWKGDMRQVIIHPKKSFAGHPDDSIDGGKAVGFRKIKLKKIGGENTDATAKLIFNP